MLTLCCTFAEHILKASTKGSQIERGVPMKTLMIVARDSMVVELEELLHKNGVNAYSIINKVEGRGKTGKVGAFHHTVYTGSTQSNLMILAVLPSDQLERAVTALKAFHATRKKLAQGDPVPLKLFAFPCEELL
jgi:nitrogen regulatory protein PII